MLGRNSAIINIAPNQAKNDNALNHTASLTYLHYLKVCLVDKICCFRGRARRKEYLAFQLADFIVAAVFFSLIHYLGTAHNAVLFARDVVSTFLIVPLLSVSVRRFHDTGLSGWWCLLAVVPFAVLAYLLIKDSDRETNKYGAVPEGKTFTQPWYARFMNGKKAPENNVVIFEPQKRTTKQNKRAA